MISGRSSDMRRHKLMPPGYDLTKEPVARYAMKKKGVRQEGPVLSGYTYVVVLMNGDQHGGKVRIAKQKNCRHGETICDQTVPDEGEKLTCSQSWQLDYSILWSRTAGGRSMISALGPQADQHQNPNHPAAIHNRRYREAAEKDKQASE